MSVMLRTHAVNVFDNVFIFYNFSQVRDAIMLVAFFEKLGRWEKVFIYYSGDKWKVETLKKYFNKEKYNWICNKLNMIIQHNEHSNQFEGMDFNKDMNIDSEFVIGLDKLD